MIRDGQIRDCRRGGYDHWRGARGDLRDELTRYVDVSWPTGSRAPMS